MHSDPRQWQLGLVGYGEVGRILSNVAATTKAENNDLRLMFIATT